MSDEKPKEFYKSFFKIAVPLAIQGVLISAISVTDSVMLGQVSQEALSAVSMAGQINLLFMNIIIALCTGACGLAAQYWGKGDGAAVERVMYLTLQITGIIAFVFFAACFVMPSTVMALMTNEPRLIEIGAKYLRIVSVSFLFIGISQIYLTIMKSVNQVKNSTQIDCMMAILNIFLNYLLIFGHAGFPEMGAIGAALATTVSRFFGLFATILISRTKKAIKIDVSNLFKNYKALRAKYFRYTFLGVVRSGTWTLASTIAIAIIGRMGSEAILANALVMIVFNLATGVSNGLATATSIYIGQELGDNRLKEAKRDGNRCLLVCGIVGVVIAVLMLFTVEPLIAFQEGELSKEALWFLQTMMIIKAVKFIGQNINSPSSRGILSVGGDIRYISILDMTNMWLVILPLGLLAAFVWDLPVIAVYIILNIDEFTKMPLQFKRVNSGKWVKNLTKNEWADPRQYGDEIRSNILQKMPVGVLLVGSYGQIVYINAAAEKFLNIKAETLQGESLMRMMILSEENDEMANFLIDGLQNKGEVSNKAITYCDGEKKHELALSTLLIEEDDLSIGLCVFIREKT